MSKIFYCSLASSFRLELEMENSSGAQNPGPVALTLPPTTSAFKTKSVQRDVVVESAVQLVCTNPGCTVANWMDVDDWEARVTSGQRQQQRGWNGDEDDWRLDHRGSSAAAPEQLVCPCGRGWRRRATMPSTSSPAAVAVWLERLQQLRLMRRSEPMLAVDAGVPPHRNVDWTGPYQWPLTPADSDRGVWTSRPAVVQPHFGFCPQAVGTERFRPEHQTNSSRHRVFSEPETYDSTSHCGTKGYVCPGKIQQNQLLQPVNGYKSQPSANFCNGDQLGGTFPQTFKSKCVEVQGTRGQLSTGQECGSQRSLTGLTPRRPSRPDVAARPVPSSANGDASSRRPSGSRRDGASPDSMSSDSGSSAASTGSATARRKPSVTGGTGATLAGSATGRGASNACSRGNIFRQRTPAELTLFRSLSLHCNAYEVQTAGDDAPYGKDRLRTHVLMGLSAARRSTVDCVICSAQLVVYHDFPLLDGLFFESPMKYNSDVRVEPLTIGGLHRQPVSDSSKFYLNAVCFRCLQVNISWSLSLLFLNSPCHQFDIS